MKYIVVRPRRSSDERSYRMTNSQFILAFCAWALMGWLVAHYYLGPHCAPPW